MLSEELQIISNTSANMKKRPFPAKRQAPNQKGLVNTPQFMEIAGEPNASIEAVRQFIKKQKRIKGFYFPLVAGDNQDLNIDLSGTARTMLGLVIFNNLELTADPADLPKEITFKVNNEIIIEKLHTMLLSSQSIDEEYYFIPRPLSGQDDIKISFNGVGKNQDIFLAIYYI